MKAISKITMKVLCGGKIEVPTARTLVATILGEIGGVKKQASAFDPDKTQYKFTGHFEGVIASTGEVVESGTAYFNDSLSELIASKEVGSMFAVKIFIEPSAKSPTKYAFDFESAIDSKPSDRLAALREAAGVKLLDKPVASAIAAPAKPAAVAQGKKK
jgi:hypothetical protein